MDKWHMAIEGEGAHHNKDYPRDANRLLTEFVRTLIHAGQLVDGVTFTYGGRDEDEELWPETIEEPPVRIIEPPSVVQEIARHEPEKEGL